MQIKVGVLAGGGYQSCVWIDFASKCTFIFACNLDFNLFIYFHCRQVLSTGKGREMM